MSGKRISSTFQRLLNLAGQQTDEFLLPTGTKDSSCDWYSIRPIFLTATKHPKQ